MIQINNKTTLKELAGLICEKLREHGINAVLVGGAVVSIYTNNRYASLDLDFITHAETKEINIALAELDFIKSKRRYYSHPKTKYFVEFPSPPLSIGDKPIKKWAKMRLNTGTLELLTPTQCVMDRLAAFYHWNDRPSLEQAIMVARTHRINFNEVKDWSKIENMIEKYKVFRNKLKRKNF